MKLRFRKLNYHPYTIIEMLIVLAIIAILFAMGAGGYRASRRWLAKSNTEAILAKLKVAIEAYKNDKGYYPQPHTDPTDPESAVPYFKLDVNANDFDSGTPGDANSPAKNMNKFVDYGKVKVDQSIKIPEGTWNRYYVKDGWNSPTVTMTVSGTDYKWGAIKYRCPGLVNTTSFDLYSAGVDREFASDPVASTEDDIYAK